MSARIIDLSAARARREALAMSDGIPQEELDMWDKLLERADAAWSWRDSESLLELSQWITFLLAQQNKITSNM